jgi:hypothetical protein
MVSHVCVGWHSDGVLAHDRGYPGCKCFQTGVTGYEQMQRVILPAKRAYKCVNFIDKLVTFQQSLN